METIQFINNVPKTPKWLGTSFQEELNAAISSGALFFTTPDEITYEIINAGSIRNLSTKEIEERVLKIQINNKRSLLGLEVLKIDKKVNADNIEEEYRKLTKTEFVVLEDLSQQYILKIDWAENDSIKSLDPDFLPEVDAYEISESIQDFLTEKGFPIFKHKFPTKGKSTDLKISVEEEKSSLI